MGKRAAKKGRLLALRWILSLAAFLVLMTGLAVALKRSPATQGEPPTPTMEPNPYTAADFGYKNGYLTCLSGESQLGIDVSSHQGEIDWAQVKAAGIQFAIIRLGYRGYETGILHRDEYALENLTQAKAAGLQIGAYFFSQALNEEEARAEAHLALEILGDTELDLPIAYDWEYVSESARTGSIDADTLLACTLVFCQEMEAAGYAPMVYFNPDLANTRLDVTQLTDYPFWLAMYSGEMDYPYKLQLWQYTDEGTVPGIEGNVDLDLYFP